MSTLLITLYYIHYMYILCLHCQLQLITHIIYTLYVYIVDYIDYTHYMYILCIHC